VLTKDKRIRRRTLEREALINAGVRSFVMGSGNLKGEAMAKVLAAAMPEMLEIIAEQPPPFIARINQNGKIDLLHPPKAPKRTQPIRSG
jgi:hypothetical protein